MSITVFGASYSTRTQRVLLVLEELGRDYELKNVDLMKGEHYAPSFVESRHPLAKIPAIEVDGSKLFESRAICRFLATKYPGSLSIPSEANALGIFEQAASIEYAYFEPAVSQLGWEKIFKKAITGQDADANAIAHHEGELRRVFDYYETVLSKQDWLAGENYSLVDAFHAPWISFLKTKLGYQSEVDSRKNLGAWWARVEQRAAWQKVSGGH